MARLAQLQHGHVHLHQLRAAGIGRNAVAHRVHTGHLHPALPGVFLVGLPKRDVFGLMMAAALYFKGDGLVARRSAAHAWGLLDTTQHPTDHDPVDVLYAGRSGKRVAGVTVCRTGALADRDVRRRHGIPLTSPARTLLDLAGTMDALELEAVMSAAFRRNLVRRSNLVDVMQRNPGAKGIAGLRALLQQAGSLRDTRSTYERRLLELLSAAELPRPLTNTWVAGELVDGVWPELGLVYEFDGWLYHRDKFERDRLRDQRMLVAGYRVMRISRRQIDSKPYALVARAAAIIATLRLRPSA